jgi:hypothetical protein
MDLPVCEEKAQRKEIPQGDGDTMTAPTAAEGGLTNYYQQKVEHLELTVREKTQNLRRLQAQRNELNSKGAAS